MRGPAVVSVVTDITPTVGTYSLDWPARFWYHCVRGNGSLDTPPAAMYNRLHETLLVWLCSPHALFANLFNRVEHVTLFFLCRVFC